MFRYTLKAQWFIVEDIYHKLGDQNIDVTYPVADLGLVKVNQQYIQGRIETESILEIPYDLLKECEISWEEMNDTL